jgi:hypothetical protein
MPENMASKHRNNDIVHHVFTTKTPSKNTHFSLTPIKNARKTEENRLCGALRFF